MLDKHLLVHYINIETVVVLCELLCSNCTTVECFLEKLHWCDYIQCCRRRQCSCVIWSQHWLFIYYITDVIGGVSGHGCFTTVWKKKLDEVPKVGEVAIKQLRHSDNGVLLKVSESICTLPVASCYSSIML